MKLHKESKGTLLVATIAVALFTFLSVHYLEMYSLLVIVPLFILYGLVFWFFRVPKREILDHKENVIALSPEEYNARKDSVKHKK